MYEWLKKPRVSKNAISNTPKHCQLDCDMKVDGLCQDPRKNHSVNTAKCFKMTPKKLIEKLS